MSIKFDLKVNLAAFKAAMDKETKRVVKASQVALNETAVVAKNDTVNEMRAVFDRPTPWTLNSMRVKRASTDNLKAVVYFREEGGTPPSKYLYPQIFGGNRGMKGTEKALAAVGILPQGWVCVPGAAAKLDQYGNQSRGQLMQIRSALGAAQLTAGYNANRTKQSAKRRRNLPKFFAIKPGESSHLAPGVWQRAGLGGRMVKPVLMFVSRASYRRRLPFLAVVQRAVDREYDRAFKRAMSMPR